jgi:hypothetical protein
MKISPLLFVITVSFIGVVAYFVTPGGGSSPSGQCPAIVCPSQSPYTPPAAVYPSPQVIIAPSSSPKPKPITHTTDLRDRFEALLAIRTLLSSRESRIFAAGGLSQQSAFHRYFGSVNEVQILLYLDFARLLSPNSTICETGFHLGLSTTTFLTAAPESTTYEAFEISFKQPSVKEVMSLFGANRVHTHEGDSSITVPKFSGTCNLIHIDGSHDEPFVLSDITNFREKVDCKDNFVLLDDTHYCPDYETNREYCGDGDGACTRCNCFERGYCNGPSRAYWRAVKMGLLSHYACYSTGFDGTFMKGFCAARFVC